MYGAVPWYSPFNFLVSLYLERVEDFSNVQVGAKREWDHHVYQQDVAEKLNIPMPLEVI